MSLTRAAFRYKAYKRSPLPLRLKTFDSNGEVANSSIFDISTTGVSFVLPVEKPLPNIGENIKIDFTLMDSARISCVGRVARTQQVKGLSQSQVKIGVQFFELPLRYRLAIKKAIDKAVAEDMMLLNGAITMPAGLAERRATMLIQGHTNWESSQNDIFKIVLLFFLFGLGMYILDQNGEIFSQKNSPPAWSTKFFEMRAQGTGGK